MINLRIIGEYLRYALFKSLRTNNSLVYSVSVGINSDYYGCHLFIKTSCEEKNILKLLKNIILEIQKIKLNDIDKNILYGIVKKRELSYFNLSFNSSNIIETYYQEEIENQIYYKNKLLCSPNEYIKKIKELDINSLYKITDLIEFKNFTIGIFGKKKINYKMKDIITY